MLGYQAEEAFAASLGNTHTPSLTADHVRTMLQAPGISGYS